MYGKLTVNTPATTYPVTVDLVKSHSRILMDDDDSLINIYIGTATTITEAFLNRSLINQTLTWSISDTYPPNSWPMLPAPVLILPLSISYNLSRGLQRDIELPRSPVSAINSVEVGDWGTDDSTLIESTDYDTDMTCDPARVRVHSDINWGNRRHISITYTAGYGATSDSIPTPIIHAVLMTTAWLYEHRGDQDSNEMPAAARNLLWNYRQLKFWGNH